MVVQLRPSWRGDDFFTASPLDLLCLTEIYPTHPSPLPTECSGNQKRFTLLLRAGTTDFPSVCSAKSLALGFPFSNRRRVTAQEDGSLTTTFDVAAVAQALSQRMGKLDSIGA